MFQSYRIQIRSKHAIEYLKGRFHTLKGLRVLINSSDAHIIATYWIAACVGIHSFALKHEILEHQEQDSSYDKNSPHHDSFIDKGLLDSEDDIQEGTTGGGSSRVPARLQHRKAHREQIKAWLF
jgi:hypothetical protein